ncbi:MAG: penicillin-binding transpeptidase domain-containing protein, partial [Pseudohongiella sp.]
MIRRNWVAVGLFSVGLLQTSLACAETEIVGLPYARSVIETTGYQGNMLVYDMNEGRYFAAFTDDVEQQHIPASTFKIMSSLVVLEAGAVADADTVLAWDGVTRSRAETNADMSLRSAFQLSSVPHYQAMVRQVGEQAMQAAISGVGYGNEDIGGGIDQFWLTGDLRISPAQQINLLQRLYQDELPFSTQTMQTVRDIMVVENTPDYVLRAKTGLAVGDEEEYTGWWVGWVEHGDNVTFFATVLTATAPDSGFIPARLSVT